MQSHGRAIPAVSRYRDDKLYANTTVNGSKVFAKLIDQVDTECLSVENGKARLYMDGTYQTAFDMEVNASVDGSGNSDVNTALRVSEEKIKQFINQQEKK